MSESALVALLAGAFGNSAHAFANTGAPGAGQTLVQVQGLSGLYLAECWVGYSAGAPAAAEIGNMILQAGAQQMRLPVHPVLSRLDYFATIFLVTGALNSIAITANGAATAGVNYLTLLKVTKIGGP